MAWLGAVVQGVTGIAQTIAASEAAKKLPEAQQYTPSPQMRRAEDMALRRAEQGMSAAERAAFEQGMARRTGAAERAMRNIGLAGVAQGVSNIFNIDAMNQFAAQSEAERRRGEQMYAGIAGQMQAIQDMETSSFNQMLQQQRTALGQAAASGMKNLTGAFGMAAQAANTAKLAEAYAGSGDTYNYNLGGGGGQVGGGGGQVGGGGGQVGGGGGQVGGGGGQVGGGGGQAGLNLGQVSPPSYNPFNIEGFLQSGRMFATNPQLRFDLTDDVYDIMSSNFNTNLDSNLSASSSNWESYFGQ
jgi:hypothetical protein